MYNPLGSNPLDNEVSEFFKALGIILVFVRDAEKVDKIKVALRAVSDNRDLTNAIAAHIMGIGIHQQRDLLIDLAESLGFWNSPLVVNNPIWAEYIYQKTVSYTDEPSPKVMEALLRACQYCPTEAVTDLIYLGLVDRDSFEETQNKIGRFESAIKTYRKLCSAQGIEQEISLNKICDAVCNTNVPYNRRYAEVFVKEFDKLIGNQVPALEFARFFTGNSNLESDEIPFFERSYIAELNKHCSSIPRKLRFELIKSLKNFPEHTLNYLKSLPPHVLNSRSNLNVIEAVLHGDWLDGHKDLQDSFMGFVNKLFQDEFFKSARLTEDGMREASGSVASLISCEFISNAGAHIQIPDDREASACRSAIKNMESVGQYGLSAITKVVKGSSSARNMIKAYKKIRAAEVVDGDSKVLEDLEEILGVAAVNILAEMRYMSEKKKPISEETPYHYALGARENKGNKYHSHEDFIRIILADMSPDKMLSVIEKKSMVTPFLKYMLKNKAIPMSYASKLKLADRRALLEADLDF